VGGGGGAKVLSAAIEQAILEMSVLLSKKAQVSHLGLSAGPMCACVYVCMCPSACVYVCMCPSLVSCVPLWCRPSPRVSQQCVYVSLDSSSD
jgi:hypothetical protein